VENSAAGTRRTLVERLRGILATKHLTLYGIAALTRLLHAQESVYHLPHNFYYQLQSAGLTPTLYQLSAFAELSNYRFADWLRVFEFRLDDISRLQAALPRPRTALLDSTVHDISRTIAWFRDRPSLSPTSSVAPLSQLLEPSGTIRLSSLFVGGNSRRFHYAKIGQQDAFAFPDLAPGSIVRANPRLVAQCLRQTKRNGTRSIFLVEHRGGFCCSRLHFGSRNRATLLPTQLPFASVELQLGSEIRILGLVDLEIRPLTHPKRLVNPICSSLPEVPAELARLWTPGLLEESTAARRPAHLIRDARLRAALSFRTASTMSRNIAKALNDKRYSISQGSLSDYEANDTPPRHLHKLFSLSILFALPFSELLRSFGVDASIGASPIPDEWMPGHEERENGTIAEWPARGFLSNALEHLGELPFFLYGSLASLSGLPELSLHDIFWVGGQAKALHPTLAGATFVVVNRRKNTPPAFRRKSLWEQPLYLVRLRGESYLLANCTLEDKMIVVHPPPGFLPQERLRNRVDAEVVGQIVAVLRSLFPFT
jgi:hypothetical protein